MEEKFARFEALLTHTNIFSTPKVPVSTIAAPISEQPFFTLQPLRAVGVLFSPVLSGLSGGQLVGRAGGRAAGQSLSGLYLRNHKV